jgi:hypothetical protein
MVREWITQTDEVHTLALVNGATHCGMKRVSM